jgi:hypothetical protein
MKIGMMTTAVVAMGLVALSAEAAMADTLINTIGGDTYNNGNGSGYSIYSDDPSFGSVALEFSAGGDSLVTGVKALIGAAGSVQIGLMTNSAGVPSGTFIGGDVVDVVLSGAHPVNLNSLNWSITPGGTYWLVAVADPNTSAEWQYGGVQSSSWAYAYGTDSISWVPDASGPPDAIVTGGVATTPLPAALPLFASGIGALGLFGWRRRRRKAPAI